MIQTGTICSKNLQIVRSTYIGVHYQPIRSFFSMGPPGSKLRFMERAPRFADDIRLELKTFGSSTVCELEAINISITGLLTCAFSDTLPFKTSTIIELTIDPRQEKLPISIDCFAKIARTERIAFHSEDKNHDHDIILFGIHFTDMETAQFNIWDRYVGEVESKALAQGETLPDHQAIVAKCLLTKPKNKGSKK